jgi:hypothetical protein
MNNNTVKLPDFEAMEEMVKNEDNKQGIFSLIEEWIELLGGNVTLSQLATVDTYYTTLPSKEEWRNVRNNRAGYVPMRRAAIALAKLVATKKKM